MLLERDKWKDVYATFEVPVNPNTGKPYKSGAVYDKALEEFEAQGLIGVPQEAFDAFSEVEISLKESGLSDYLTSPFKEVPLVAEVDDVRLKGRLDIYSEQYGIVDLKSTGWLFDARGVDKMYWNCRDYGYFDELAYFSLIVEAKTGYLPPCQIVAVQIAPPYQVGLYKISGKTISESIERIREEYLPTWKTYSRGDSFLYNAVLRTY